MIRKFRSDCGSRRMLHRPLVVLCGLAAALALMLAPGMAVHAGSISGTLSNFDVFNDNDSSTSSDGAELELEGIHMEDVLYHYPSHYVNFEKTEFVEPDGITVSTRLLFTDYEFGLDELLDPAPSQSTNGHTCVGLAACEHFGFSVRQQPTALRFYWLDDALQRISPTPLSIPSPTWTYNPPLVLGDPPRIGVAVEIEPVEIEEQRPDSMWMKVYKTEIEREVDLDELVSGDGDGVVPEGEVEVEIEWELLEGGREGDVGKKLEDEDGIGENVVSIVRRYEFYEYTGEYDGEHEPLPQFIGQEGMDPSDFGELGKFIVANMVAVNFVPEPTTLSLMLAGAVLLHLIRGQR